MTSHDHLRCHVTHMACTQWLRCSNLFLISFLQLVHVRVLFLWSMFVSPFFNKKNFMRQCDSYGGEEVVLNDGTGVVCICMHV